MASRRTLTTAFAIAALLVPVAAFAKPTSADRETARALMQQGRDLRDKGDLQGALKRFKGADEIMHVPTTALEVARAQVALGLLVEARDSIAAIRRSHAEPGEPAPFSEARGKADELDASLNGRIPALTIILEGAPDGEVPAVTIDGAPIPGVLGLARRVDPGHHVIVARSAHAEGKQEVDVREGEQKPVEVTLVVTAEPKEPAPSTDAAPETPPTRSHAPTVLTWAGIGLAGAGAIVGTVTGVLSLSKKSTLQSQCANDICGPAQYSDYDSANTNANISTIAFIAAGVGAGVAVVTLLIGHDETIPPASTPSEAALVVVRPWLGLGTCGIHGQF